MYFKQKCDYFKQFETLIEFNLICVHLNQN